MRVVAAHPVDVLDLVNALQPQHQVEPDRLEEAPVDNIRVWYALHVLRLMPDWKFSGDVVTAAAPLAARQVAVVQHAARAHKERRVGDGDRLEALGKSAVGTETRGGSLSNGVALTRRCSLECRVLFHLT